MDYCFKYWLLPNHYNVDDSIQHGNTSSRVKQQICALVYSDSKEISLKFQSVQFQKGSYCGLFCVAFATSVCAGLDPAYLCHNQDIFREHVLYCIENKYISPFPSTIEERPNSTVERTITLYCLCRQPEVGGESMV